MLRGVLRLAAWAVVAWLFFFVPVEGRSWARHMQEIWRLPEVAAKGRLLRAQAASAVCRLRHALPPAARTQEHHEAADRRALDRLLEDAQATPPGGSREPTGRP